MASTIVILTRNDISDHYPLYENIHFRYCKNVGKVIDDSRDRCTQISVKLQITRRELS
jgi:hypothetical protein